MSGSGRLGNLATRQFDQQRNQYPVEDVIGQYRVKCYEQPCVGSDQVYVFGSATEQGVLVCVDNVLGGRESGQLVRQLVVDGKNCTWKSKRASVFAETPSDRSRR